MTVDDLIAALQALRAANPALGEWRVCADSDDSEPREVGSIALDTQERRVWLEWASAFVSDEPTEKTVRFAESPFTITEFRIADDGDD